MKRVVKASSIGDKMYNIGRVHSKLVFINSKYNKVKQENILQEQIKALLCLKKYIECLTIDHKVKYTDKYISSIQQTIDKISKGTMNDVFVCCCYMSGCFYKFKINLLKKVKRSCQKDFDDFSLPLFYIELERKDMKKQLGK